MNLNFQYLKENPTKIIIPLLLTVLVIIGTFPENDWSFSNGIDPPLKWVFNSLFETGLFRARRIIFPHGPLAFLMYPLSENILLVSLIISLLKATLVFGASGLLNRIDTPFKWIAVIAFAYSISIVAKFNHLLLACVILLYLNYYQYRLSWIKIGAFILTAIAFYVKAYIAILTGAMFISFLIYEYIKYRKFRSSLNDALTMLGFILLTWTLMYKTLTGFIHYFWGILNLAQDNSAAAALYPQNNWLWISLSFIAVLILVLINRTQKTIFWISLIAFSLFAAWKHGMAREDIFHIKGIQIFLFISLFTYLLFEPKRLKITAVLAFISVLFFSLNMKNSVNYFTPHYKLWTGQNFIEFATKFNKLKTRAHQVTAENLKENRLPENILNTISNEVVDVYPWDYSIVAINNLNWHPRVIIQSYAAYTSWLDQQNATYFNSELSPKYIIWEKEKTSKDLNGGGFSSIDNRYLLNDEPQSIIQILSNYEPLLSEGKFLLLKKRTQPISFEAKSIESTGSEWNKWIDVPESGNDLLRCKLFLKKSWKQKLKSFIYKDEQFWIYLKLKNGEIHKYRIVPKNAEDGLWINPYFFKDQIHYKVDQVLITASNQEILNNEIKAIWEKIIFDNNYTIDFFEQEKFSMQDSFLFRSSNTFDIQQNENWSSVGEEQLSRNSYTGEKAHLLNNTYSCTFSLISNYSLDRKIKIAADAWIKALNYKEAKSIFLVLKITKQDKDDIYKQISIDEQLIDDDSWNHIYSFIEVDQIPIGSQISAYFWNTEDQEILIDEFRVQISTETTTEKPPLIH